MTTILSLSHVKKTFDVGESFDVLRNITLEVNEGEFVSIVGPSGCGKSILLYLIAGFIPKTSGELRVNDIPISQPGTDRMMVFQEYGLLPWKSVYDNVLFGLEKSALSKKERKERVMKYIDLVGLVPFKDWHIYKLSGGMKQRVAIARALAVNSNILLMDEPFSALDPQQRKYLQKSLLDIWNTTKNTILFVTHSVNEALYLSDRIYVMSARPAIIKKIYTVTLSRPRNTSDPEYIRLREDIEKDLFEEFEKTREKQGREVITEAVLKTKIV